MHGCAIPDTVSSQVSSPLGNEPQFAILIHDTARTQIYTHRIALTTARCQAAPDRKVAGVLKERMK